MTTVDFAGRPRRLRGLKLKRVSLVDSPANLHARVEIFKSAPTPGAVHADGTGADEGGYESLQHPRLAEMWSHIKAAAARQFPGGTSSLQLQAYFETPEGERAQRQFAQLRERVTGVDFSEEAEKPTMKSDRDRSPRVRMSVGARIPHMPRTVPESVRIRMGSSPLSTMRSPRQSSPSSGS